MTAKDYERLIMEFCLYCMGYTAGENLNEVKRAIRDECSARCPLYTVRPYRKTEERGRKVITREDAKPLEAEDGKVKVSKTPNSGSKKRQSAEKRKGAKK